MTLVQSLIRRREPSRPEARSPVANHRPLHLNKSSHIDWHLS